MSCNAPGCDRPQRAEDKWCPMHRTRLSKYGVLEPYEPTPCQICATPIPHNGRGSRRTVCVTDDCQRAYNRIKSREYRNRRKTDPEYASRTVDAARRWVEKNPERRRDLARRRGLRIYGLTVADYDALLADQGGGCAICGYSSPGSHLHVDHDHGCCPGVGSCGKCVRGLLCRRCNQALGQFADSAELLDRASGYLRAHRASKVIDALKKAEAAS